MNKILIQYWFRNQNDHIYKYSDRYYNWSVPLSKKDRSVVWEINLVLGSRRAMKEELKGKLQIGLGKGCLTCFTFSYFLLLNHAVYILYLYSISSKYSCV